LKLHALNQKLEQLGPLQETSKNCLITSIFRALFANKSRITNAQNNMIDEKTRKSDMLAKLFQAMRYRNIC